MDKGSSVSIEYTLFAEDGSKVDTNVGEEPLEFEHGAEEILPALETALAALGEGESTKITLGPDEAYGDVDPEAFQEVPLDAVPDDGRSVGAQLVYADEEGTEHAIRVHEVKDDAVVIDFNHPLAGSTITFEVKVLAIQPPSASDDGDATS